MPERVQNLAVRMFRRRPAEGTSEEATSAPADERIEEHEVLHEQRPRPPWPGPIWPWLLLLLVVVLGGLGALYVLGREDDENGGESARTPTVETAGTTGPATTGTEEPVEVEVPGVVGLRLSRAVSLLGDAGFEARPRGVFSGEPLARVVSQKPEAGEAAERGAAVRVNFSKGRGRVDVPDVLGLRRAEAVTLLEGAGLEARPFPVPSAEPEGTVVAQNPPPGSKAAKDDRVRINVSDGRGGAEQPNEVTVADVVGLELRDAQAELREAGLTVRIFYVPSQLERGVVVAQRPRPGTSVKRGTSVRLNVSEGPRPGQRVAVPDVVGLEEDEAVGELEAAGFEVEVVPEPTPDETEHGIVVRQEPEAGLRAPRGALVTIYVGEFTG